MGKGIVYFSLIGPPVVAHSVKLTSSLEYSLHLAEKLGFVVVSTDHELGPLVFGQNTSAVAYVYKDQIGV